jgi:transposase
MRYIGWDAHQGKWVMCILDANGKKVKEPTVRGPWDDLLAALREQPRPWRIVYEASTEAGYLYDQLQPLAERVGVAHPGKLRLLFQSRRKNDRVDAAKLALLLFLDQVPPAYMPEPEVRAWRGLIEPRQRLVQKRTRRKNQLRCLLRGCGVPARGLRPAAPPAGGPRKGWGTVQGLAVLRELPLPSPLDGLRRDQLLEELAQLNRQVQRAEQELDRVAGGPPGVAVLRSIPGVGPRTAEAVLASIDQASRFGRLQQGGAYFGLVPSQDASADTHRLGPITKQGPATGRHLLGEAGGQGIRRSPTLRRFYARGRQGKAERTRIALVATAHYVLRVMRTLLRQGSCWQEADGPTPTEATACRQQMRAGRRRPGPQPSGRGTRPRTPVGAMTARRSPPQGEDRSGPREREGGRAGQGLAGPRWCRRCRIDGWRDPESVPSPT